MHRIAQRAILLLLLASAGFCSAQDKPPAGVIRGRVVSELTSRPVASVIVTLESTDKNVPLQQAKTGEDGAYVFRNLPLGEYILSATGAAWIGKRYGEEYGEWHVAPLTLKAASATATADLRMLPAPVVEEMPDAALRATWNGQPGNFEVPYARFSPDGSRLALAVGKRMNHDANEAWMYDLRTNRLRSVSALATAAMMPIVGDLEWSGNTLWFQAYGKPTPANPTRAQTERISGTGAAEVAETPGEIRQDFDEWTNDQENGLRAGAYRVQRGDTCKSCWSIVSSRADGSERWTVERIGSYFDLSQVAVDPKLPAVLYAMGSNRINVVNLRTRARSHVFLPTHALDAVVAAVPEGDGYRVAFTVHDSACKARLSADGSDPWLLLRGEHKLPFLYRVCFVHVTAPANVTVPR